MNGTGVLEKQDYEFAAAIQRRPVHVTYIILGVNLLIFALMTFAGGSEDGRTLLAFGAKSNEKIDQGEIWRFVTPVFIHIGLLHLLANSFALWNVGPQVEKLYGAARFLILYLGAGIAGVLGSYWFNPVPLSAGASGAIFGLFGVLLMFGLRHRNSIPPFYRQAMIQSAVPVIVINLMIGQSGDLLIDNAAHIGGLLAGAALAAVIPFARPGTTPHSSQYAIQGAAALIVLLSFFQAYRHSAGTIAERAYTFTDAVNASERAFRNSIAAVKSGDASKVVKGRSRTSAALDELGAAPSLAPGADTFRNGILAVMKDQASLEEDVERTGSVTFEHETRARKNEERYQAMNQDFRAWVRTDGREYGISLTQ